MFQKVNEWLADKSERLVRGGNANPSPAGAYYASSEAEQAYGGMRAPAPSAGEEALAGADDRFPRQAEDPYGGRVPYRSQRDAQAEAEMRRREMEEQARRQQAAAQQMQMQQFNRPQAQPAATQPSANVVAFPGMIRGPEGNVYAHVEYVVLLRNRNECTKVIEYIKSNASVFLNMEFIANDGERQRCVDMLSGAAYTLGCRLNKISQRGIYLISSPSVYVVMDPAMQRYTATETQGYRRAEYGGYGNAPAYTNQAYGYAQQQGAGYGMGQAPQYGGQQPNAGYAVPRNTGYASPQNAGYAAPQNAGYDTRPQGAGYDMNTQASGYGMQPNTGYGARTNAGFTAEADTGAYQARHSTPQEAYEEALPNPQAEGPARRAAFNPQGAFWKGYENAAGE